MNFNQYMYNMYMYCSQVYNQAPKMFPALLEMLTDEFDEVSIARTLSKGQEFLNHVDPIG